MSPPVMHLDNNSFEVIHGGGIVSTKNDAARAPFWRHRRVGAIAVMITAVVAVVIGVSVILTGQANPKALFVPVDPPGATEADRWGGATAGLSLRVINACNDEWTEFFDASLNDWSASPSLQLTPTRSIHQPDCEPEMKHLKVCNGNYGNTDWQGLNTILLRREVIVWSTAKLNDDQPMDYDRKYYTMCHEIGHGFGLPHSDENHFNLNRGDCMDYTTRPSSNKMPGQHNFNLLQELYGTPSQPLLGESSVGVTGSNNLRPNRSGGNTRRRRHAVEEEEDFNSTVDATTDNDLEASEEESLSEDSSDDEPVPISIQQEALRQGSMCDKDYCTTFLGNGYRVEINKLRF